MCVVSCVDVLFPVLMCVISYVDVLFPVLMCVSCVDVCCFLC